jgi:outer membrane usher protein
MARRPRKTCRWPITLAEVLLLQGLLVGAGHAAATASAAAANVAVSASGALDDSNAYNSATSGGEDLYLDATLNGTPKGLVHFGYRGGELWATAATLRQLGFALPDNTLDPLRLKSLKGVTVDYDASRQQVTITAPLELLNLSTTVLNAPGSGGATRASTSPGLLLNYDLYGTQGAHGNGNLNAYTELRAFGAAGVLSNTMLSQVSHGNGEGWRGQSVRLDTSWSTSFPDSMVTLRVGDTLSGYLPWSRATRIAGVQISRNFALQPYRVTAPLPTFLGSAVLPSDVELYVDGVRQYSGKVPAGPFQLNTVPNISGAGNAQIVLTDALGRATTLNFPLYAAHQLLQQGLSDWSAEVGVVRRNYGLHSFDYGHDPAGSGTFRYGVTDHFTLESHAEATSGLANGGTGGAWLFDRAGILSASAAFSHDRGRSGSQFNLGYNWRNDRFNFSVDGTRTNSGYRDVASRYGATLPRLSAQAQIGYSTGPAGDFGVSYLHLRYPQERATRYANAYWFKTLGSTMSLNVNINQNLDVHRDRSIFVGFSMSLDDYTSFSSSVERTNRSTSIGAQVNRPVIGSEGFGWRAQARAGGGFNGGLAEATYRNNALDLRAGVNSTSGDHYAYANADGALVLMGGQPFAARRIDDGFAVVSTDGIPDVPVMLENRVVGHTDDHGMLLVTPLNAYQSNLLAIDPMQLPADLRIDRVKINATPSDRAGTLVRFGITPVRAASIQLQDTAGKPLPVGSRVHQAGGADNGAIVGFDGTVYLDNLDTHNVLDVDTPDGSCRASFDYRKEGDGIPLIGPLTCGKD